MYCNKVFNIIFFLLCTFMCFTHLPERYCVSGFLFGILRIKLIIYPVVAGMVYTAYCVRKSELICADWGIFKRYILIYAVLSVISIVVGLVNFPYYDVIYQTSMEQFQKFMILCRWLGNMGIDVSERGLLPFWMFLRYVKGFCVNTFFTFGIAYMVYCWYVDDWKCGFKVMGYGCLTGLAIVLPYGILDILYLAHCQVGEDFLTILNPCVHPVMMDGGWWPHMFLNAFRSLFCEPSFFGMWSAVSLPFVWYQCLCLKFGKKWLLFLVMNVHFSFCLFLSNSRTCIGILLIELMAMIVALLWQRNFDWLKKCSVIIVGVIFAFGLNVGFQCKFMHSDTGVFSVTQNYIDQNIKTISYANKGRSNSQRWAVIQSDISLFADHPFFGVGQGLSRFYVYDYLPKDAFQNWEVQYWHKRTKEYGIMKNAFPALSEYPYMLAQLGIFAGFVHYLPLLMLIYKFLSMLWYRQFTLEHLTLGLALLGTVITGLNDTFNHVGWIWILYGICFAMFYGKDNESVKGKD